MKLTIYCYIPAEDSVKVVNGQDQNEEKSYVADYSFAITDSDYMNLRSHLANLMNIDFYINDRMRVQYECPEELVDTPVMNFLLHSDRHGEFTAQELKDLLNQVDEKIPEEIKSRVAKENDDDIKQIESSFYDFLKNSVENNWAWEYCAE